MDLASNMNMSTLQYMLNGLGFLFPYLVPFSVLASMHAGFGAAIWPRWQTDVPHPPGAGAIQGIFRGVVHRGDTLIISQ